MACGRTAARAHGFPLVDDDDPATGAAEHLLDDVAVVEPAGRLECGGRVLTRYQRRYGRADLTRLESGLWVTSPLRTLVDCARLLAPDALVCAMDDALHRELVTASTLADAVTARAWCASAVGLRSAVARADGRAESAAETLTRLLVLPSLPGLVPQHRLLDDRGRVLARFDLGDEQLRLAVETDGKAGHAGERMVAKDQRRDRTSNALGWRTERCTWWELRCRQAQLLSRIVEAAADLARRHGRRC